MNRQASTFMNNLSAAARDNPLAAALVGGGALWLMLGNRALGSAASSASSVIQPLAENGLRGVSDVANAAAGGAERVASSVTDAAQSAARTLGDAAASGASSVKGQVTSVVDRAAEALRATPSPLPALESGYSGVKSALAEILERQPLVLGVVGLAIGAGVGSAIAATAQENEWAGSLSDSVKDAVKEHAGHVVETAQRAAAEVGQEFRSAAGQAADGLRRTSAEAAHAVRGKVDPAVSD